MEFVYVVKRSDLFDIACPQGFMAQAADPDRMACYLGRAREKGFFIERRFTEQDSSFKQIIPYVVVMRGGEVLTLRRKKSQGEARLHNKLSIGIGGHINPGDGSSEQAAGDTGETATDRPFDVLEEGMRRELNEELSLSAPPPVTWMGILNDDSNDVGAVHLGVVARTDVTGIDVRVREQEMMEGEFIDAAALQRMTRDPDLDFETWSRLLIDKISVFTR